LSNVACVDAVVAAGAVAVGLLPLKLKPRVILRILVLNKAEMSPLGKCLSALAELLVLRRIYTDLRGLFWDKLLPCI